ncbi:MAG: hypothetical protein QMD73_07710 [Rhodocyclaceae bacterium]|nr:hypothetical protein [Rhodocyclaceae bacterium]
MTDELDPRGLAIQPVSVGDLPAFLKAIEPVVKELASGDVLGALMRHADAVIEATAIGAKVDRAWLEAQQPDVLVDLASKIIEANADFFVQRVLPVIQATAERLGQIASGGTSGSPGSSQQASPTVT